MPRPSDSDQPTGFAGMTVAAFESRMADRMAALISRHGGIPLVAPSMQEIPLENNSEALNFADHLMTGSIDMLILLTGVGTRTLVDVWKTRFSLEDITHALMQTTLLARGPKSSAALKELGLTPHIAVPEPNTWETILHTLDTFKPDGLSNLRIAIQEYGAPNKDLVEGLTKRGAHVTTVPVYRWALPDDVQPLQRALRSILDGNVAVALFTSAAQVDHVVEMLHTTNELEAFRHALRRTMVASIGPVTSRRLSHHHFPVDFEPSHSKMGILVKEASERVIDTLNRKRGSGKRGEVSA